MKGCLKWQQSPSPSPGIECNHSRKCVAFGAEICEEVYIADEWDRTPTEPAGKLSYQDMLELKEIQRTLPRANQPPDLITGRPSSHFLSAVPIGLLPLLPESDSSQNSSSTPSPVTSPSPSSPTTPNWSSFSPSSRQLPAVPAWRPPHLAHLLPAKPTPQRQTPRFAFLPLLDTPPSSPYPSNPPSRSPSPDLHSDTDQSLDPPTPSLTNASLDSSPVSRASSCSPEPPSLRLPPPQTPMPNECRHLKSASLSSHHTNTHRHDSYFPAFSDEQVPEVHPAIHPAVAATMRLHAVPSPSLVPPSPLFLGPGSTSSQGSSPRQKVPIVAPKPQRRRNFIVVNDIEIDLDDDDEDEAPQPAPTPRPSSAATIREPETILPTTLSNKNSQTTHHPPESPAIAPQENGKLPTIVLGSKHDLDIKPTPSPSPPSLKIKAVSAPASPISAGALHAPICFKRVVPTARDRAVSPSSCKSGSTFSPTSSPLLVPSA